jgi:hypothetical protein
LRLAVRATGAAAPPAGAGLISGGCGTGDESRGPDEQAYLAAEVPVDYFLAPNWEAANRQLLLARGSRFDERARIGTPARRAAAHRLALVPRSAALPAQLGGPTAGSIGTLLDEHGAIVGAGPAVPLPLPQRRDQRDPGKRQLDASA